VAGGETAIIPSGGTPQESSRPQYALNELTAEVAGVIMMCPFTHVCELP
jgi:hypothetical protein